MRNRDFPTGNLNTRRHLKITKEKDVYFNNISVLRQEDRYLAIIE